MFKIILMIGISFIPSLIYADIDSGNIGGGEVIVGWRDEASSDIVRPRTIITDVGTITDNNNGSIRLFSASSDLVSSKTGWKKDGSKVYTYNSADNVGIGNTSPAATYKLEVTGNSKFSGDVNITGNLTAVTDQTVSGNITMGDDKWIGLGSGKGLIQFDDTTTDEIEISNANVGIGTTGPSGKLQVSADTSGYLTKFTQTGIGNANIRLERTAGTTAGWEWYIPTGTTDLRLFDPGNSDRVTFQNGGNLGIGTTGPGVKLDVQGGRTSLSAVSEPYALKLTRSDIAGGQGVYIGADTATTTPTGALYNNLGTAILVWQHNGNVGIGTTSPVGLLQVGTSPNAPLIVESNGQVGIGTTNASARLEIIPANTTPAESLYINVAGSRIVMKSPDGTCSACGPDNTDTWACASVICP